MVMSCATMQPSAVTKSVFSHHEVTVFYSGEQAAEQASAPVRSRLRGRGQVSEAIQRLMSSGFGTVHRRTFRREAASAAAQTRRLSVLGTWRCQRPATANFTRHLQLNVRGNNSPCRRRTGSKTCLRHTSAEHLGTFPMRRGPDHVPSASTGLDKTASVMSWLSKQPQVARVGASHRFNGSLTVNEDPRSLAEGSPWTRRSRSGSEDQPDRAERCWW